MRPLALPFGQEAIRAGRSNPVAATKVGRGDLAVKLVLLFVKAETEVGFGHRIEQFEAHGFIQG